MQPNQSPCQTVPMVQHEVSTMYCSKVIMITGGDDIMSHIHKVL